MFPLILTVKKTKITTQQIIISEIKIDENVKYEYESLYRSTNKVHAYYEIARFLLN
jgi:hypothetical protein